MRSVDKQKILENELAGLDHNRNESIGNKKDITLRDNIELDILNKIGLIKFNCFKCVRNTCTNDDRDKKGKMIRTSISDNKVDMSVQNMLDADFYIEPKTNWNDNTEVWICNECLDKEQKHWTDLHKKADYFEKNQNKSIVGNTVCLNPNDKEIERVYRLHEPTRNSYRYFDGKYHRHCSKCPFAEGCIICTLP